MLLFVEPVPREPPEPAQGLGMSVLARARARAVTCRSSGLGTSVCLERTNVEKGLLQCLLLVLVPGKEAALPSLVFGPGRF